MVAGWDICFPLSTYGLPERGSKKYCSKIFKFRWPTIMTAIWVESSSSKSAFGSTQLVVGQGTKFEEFQDGSHGVLRRLVWVCSSCLRPTKRALGVDGLMLKMNLTTDRLTTDKSK